MQCNLFDLGMQIVLIFLLQKSKNVKYLGRNRSHAISPVIDSLAPTFSYGSQKKKYCENGKQGNRGLGKTYQMSGNLLNYKMLDLKDRFIRVQRVSSTNEIVSHICLVL